MKESLSAMIDAQLSETQQTRLLEELSRDPELRKSWERYHLIRAVLSKELGPVVPTGLGDRIAQRIRELPLPVSSLASRVYSGRPVARWVGSAALAASVAVVAIFSVQWFTTSDSPTGAQLASQDIRAGTRWDTSEAEVANALNVYLVQHNEFIPTSEMNGVISYVRVVGYDSGQ